QKWPRARLLYYAWRLLVAVWLRLPRRPPQQIPAEREQLPHRLPDLLPPGLTPRASMGKPAGSSFDRSAGRRPGHGGRCASGAVTGWALSLLLEELRPQTGCSSRSIATGSWRLLVFTGPARLGATMLPSLEGPIANSAPVPLPLIHYITVAGRSSTS